MSIIALTPWDLSLAAALVVALAAITGWMGLGLTRGFLVAGVRTTVQLLLVGLVLKAVFANAQPLWIALIALFMLLVAGGEVMSRQKRRFAGWWGYGMGSLSMFISAFSITVFTLAVIIGNHPWYTPQYAIPLLGMMLGNTMTGIALSIDHLTGNAHRYKAVIETRLSLGETAQQAISDIRRESLRVGMIPTINAMAAAGVVSLPGMMTGQILAGTPPVEAVKYQILIMFMVTATTGFGALAAIALGSRRLFDQRQRLRLERLKDPAKR